MKIIFQLFILSMLSACGAPNVSSDAKASSPLPVTTSPPSPAPTPASTTPTTAPTPPVPAPSISQGDTLPTGIRSGGVIELECGKEYRGTLNVANLSSVTVKTVGSCGKAIINASQPVSGWQSAGTNIWSAALGFAPKQVVMQDKLLELAHTPKVNGNPYLTINSQSGDALTLQGLVLKGDISGATVRVRDTQYTIAESTVNSGYDSTIVASGFASNLAGWGAYLEGKRWMLDEPGEWAYENGMLYIYSAQQPQSVEATASNAINAKSSKGLTLDNIIVKNGLTNIAAVTTDGLVLQNVDVINATDFGIDAKCATNLSVSGSSVSNTGRDGLSIGYCGNNVKVDQSSFTNIGTELMPRMTDGAIFGGFTTNLTVTGSTFNNIGYAAIWFYTGSLVDSNTIDNACVTLDDCGAIYTIDRALKGVPSTVSNNKINNVRGTLNGNPEGIAVHGIYLDESTSAVTIAYNTLSGASSSGILVHGSFNNIVEYNTFNNNDVAQVYFSDYGCAVPVRNNIVRNNVFGSGRTYKYGVQSGDNTALWASFAGNACAPGAVDCK